MSQGRKASVDSNRRTTQKSHIPYRADDLGHGKKTGVTVDYVDHNSDDFETFEKVLTQADVVTPPHKRGRKKKRPTSPMEEFDEDGEMSMELDDSACCMRVSFAIIKLNIICSKSR
jgi:centromere protein C